MGNFRKDCRPLKRTEPRAERQVAGATLFQGDPHVPTPRNIGLLWGNIHVLKEAGILKSKFAYLHQDRAENVTRPQYQFTNDHRALRLGVSFDHDGFNIEFLALVDRVLDVDIARVNVGLSG